ncbi:MAG: tail fiber domain-containing protein [Candidatus Hydrogenedentota bacterium]
MLMRNHLCLPAVLLSLSVSAMADIILTNGADLNMNTSVGSTIIFWDGTVQSTASGLAPADHGGTNASVTGTDAFVGGGIDNTANNDSSTVGGGDGNTASGEESTVGGGFNNTASGYRSTVGGGGNNTADGAYTTVAGGVINTASNFSTVGGGSLNIASGHLSTVVGGTINTASGQFATVGGGYNNTAAGDFSFAAGVKAKIDAAHDGTFMFADSTFADFNSAAVNEFAVRASGGFRLYTNSGLTAGVTMGSGAGSWSSVSARAAKENFTPVDVIAVLEKVASMPVEEWNYKAQEDSIRHIGPMAEDFRAAFGVGDFVGRITSTDADGVALAAIQGLNLKLEAKQVVIDRLEAELAKQREEDELRDEQFASLEQRLLAMEASMK